MTPTGRTVREVIGSNVRTLRESKEWTQAHLGERLEQIDQRPGKTWPVSRVSEAERGARAFSAEEVLLFARALRQPMSRLWLIPVDVETIRLESGEEVARREIQDVSLHPDVPEEYLREVGVATMQWRDHAADLEHGLDRLLETVLKIVDEVHQQRAAVKRLKHDAFDIHSLTATARRDILRHKRGNAPEVSTI
ncbi:helix-turn-helix domain-containing protein [Microbacterium sp. A588]